VGQLHKGGPPTGAFLQLTGDEASVGADLPIPGSPYGFGRLLAAQAQGDRQALVDRGRSLLHLELVGPPREGLASLIDALRAMPI
jgi:glucose-6-phosphate isomerase